MARSETRGDTRARHRGAGHDGRNTNAMPPLTTEQQSALDALMGQIPAIAQELRAAQPGGRGALTDQLAPIQREDEPVALAFAMRLGDQRGGTARDAADVAQALGQLDARREVAREARRARLRLRSAGIPSQLDIPQGPPPVMSTSGGAPGRSATPPLPIPRKPVLVEATATRTREGGEITLVLEWREGSDPDIVRGHIYLLDFWHEGIRHFRITDAMPRKRFRQEVTDTLRSSSEGIRTTTINWAFARRLVLEALDVNTWRGTEPDAEFPRHRERIDELLLNEPEEETRQHEVAAEQDRYAREGDRPLMSSDLEAEETVANWLGAWSFGDFNLTYDLLADDNPIRRAQPREQYVDLRRQWAKEADPGALRLTLLREQERRASALWVPGSAGVVGTGKELEAFWSLILHDTPFAGQLDEVPMATLTSAATGRHWYWTAYTMRRDSASGIWTISRLRDEGAASQALTIEELHNRITEAHELAEKTAQTVPSDPRDPKAAEAVRTVTAALTASMHYDDALITKLPLDETVYRAEVDDARTLGNHERAAAVLAKMASRFTTQLAIRFELAAEQYLVAESYASQGQPDVALIWLDRAIETMTEVVEAERTAEHLQGLAELLARRGRLRQAEELLREALQKEPERGSLHADLASVLMARVSGESVEDEEQLSEERRTELMRDALAELRQAARLDNTLPGLYTRMGAIFEMLGQQEDARLAYEEAIQRDLGDAGARYALGTLYLTRNDPTRALPLLEAAVQLQPLAIPYRLSLAAAYAAVDRTREASRELDLIDRLQPNLPQVAELRATIARQGKKQ